MKYENQALTGTQEQVMRAVQDSLRRAADGPVDALGLGQQLGMPPMTVVRCLRRCAREGLVTLHEYVGQDNPTIARLTHLGEDWLARRAAAA